MFRRGVALVVALAAVLLVVDWWLDAGACAWVVSHMGLRTALGGALVLGTCIVGALSSHRGFAHSLLALCLLAAGLWLACAPLVLPFAAGFASHVALDVLNYKPVRLFFPFKRGIALGLYRSDGVADRVLFAAGCAVAVLLGVGFLLVA